MTEVTQEMIDAAISVMRKKCVVPSRISFEWMRMHFADVLSAAIDASALRDRIDKLEKALQPFADEAIAYDPPEGDDGDVAWASDFPIGALRRARAALTEAKGGDPVDNSCGDRG